MRIITFERKLHITQHLFFGMDLDYLKSVLTTDINPTLQSEKFKLAAVLIVIYGKKPFLVMTEKPENMKMHAKEISFPGGKYEKDDKDLLGTAIRETREEIGLVIDRNQIIGQLEPVTTLNSGFLILPFVAVIDEIKFLATNPEVKKILHIPLVSFLKTLRPDTITCGEKEMYMLIHQGKVVWGASARMLKQISERLKI